MSFDTRIQRITASFRCQTLMYVALLALMTGSTIPAQPPATKRAVQIGTITHSPIREASGLVASRRYKDVLWTVTDSGGPPHLWAVAPTGKLLAEYEVKDAAALDWESIAVDDQGFLYIADVGNNLGLPLRWVYRIAEPDPREAAPGAGRRSARVERILPFTFPKQPFDVEGTFVLNDSLYLISKVRSETAVYRLNISPMQPVNDRTQENSVARSPTDGTPTKDDPVALVMSTPTQQLERLGSAPGVTAVTGADISADGRRIAVVTYRELLIYDIDENVARTLARPPAARLPLHIPAVEGCCWLGDNVLLVSENRSLHRMQVPAEP